MHQRLIVPWLRVPLQQALVCRTCCTTAEPGRQGNTNGRRAVENLAVTSVETQDITITTAPRQRMRKGTPFMDVALYANASA